MAFLEFTYNTKRLVSMVDELVTYKYPVMKQNATNGPVDWAGSTSELRRDQNDNGDDDDPRSASFLLLIVVEDNDKTFGKT